MQKQSRPEKVLVFAFVLRLMGQDSVIAVVRVSKKGDFYAWSHSAWRSKRSIHMSYHESGERHLSANGKELDETVFVLQRPENLSGIQQFARFICLRGQLGEEPASARTSFDRETLLDADAAGFRDDCFSYNLFLVEPGRDDLIPTPSDVGPRVLTIFRETTPWLAVEVFQQTHD